MQKTRRIIISNKIKKILQVSLEIYVGKYPHAYAGADLWNTEAFELIQRLDGINIFRTYCPWYLADTKEEGAYICNLLISEQDKKILQVALEIYVGEYPHAYAGADLWNTEASVLIQKLCEFEIL